MKDIFKYFVIDDKKTIAYINWFIQSFPHTEFTGVDKVLYFYLSYCSELRIKALRKYLLVFLKIELKKLVREHNIRIDSIVNNNYDEIVAFEQAVQVISSVTADTYDAYCSEEVEDINNFKVDISYFMSENVKDRVASIFTEQYTKINQGEDSIKVSADTSVMLTSIQEIYNTEKLKDLDLLIGNVNYSDEDDVARLISKTGILAIDEDYGGVFSKALITFAGQTGGGKTRLLCSAFIYPALVHYKVGVRLDELELSAYEVRNMLVSIHISKLYKLKIPDKIINRNELNEEQRRIVDSARIDLFKSNKYGRFIIETKDMNIETMYDEAYNYLTLNRDIQIWAIDYIGYISSKPNNKYEIKSDAEIIDRALVNCKKLAKKLDIAVIGVNQFNKEGNMAAFAGKPITSGMIQGGQSVQRHSDYDLAMTFTAEQKLAGIRMLSTTKDRASVGFTNVALETDLAICKFNQIAKIEERS